MQQQNQLICISFHLDFVTLTFPGITRGEIPNTDLMLYCKIQHTFLFTSV